MKRLHIIQYEWWNTFTNNREISEHIMEQLDQFALDIISEVVFKQNCTEGSFHKDINGISYSGCWKFQFN